MHSPFKTIIANDRYSRIPPSALQAPPRYPERSCDAAGGMLPAEGTSTAAMGVCTKPRENSAKETLWQKASTKAPFSTPTKLSCGSTDL